MKTMKRPLAFFMIFSLLVTLLCSGRTAETEVLAASSTMRSISSFDFVSDMGIGWNLGNTLDSYGDWIPDGSSTSVYETAWGNPVTTKAMFQAVKNAGFSTVRIPVTWYQHMDSNNTVDTEWMDRVQTVVDYALDCGLYVILNIHHEDSWVIPTYTYRDSVASKLTSLWTQIANRFKNYGDYLIFETLNEPREVGGENEWWGATAEVRDVVNYYNHTCLNAIRATGGNNAKRFVMVPTVAASPCENAVNGFVLPSDSATDRLLVSLHIYTPYDFSQNEAGTSYWGSSSDYTNMKAEFDRAYNKFVANGTPVVIGEHGNIDKSNTSSRVENETYFCQLAKSYNMCPVWWDNGQNTTNGFGILDRNTLSWTFSEIVTAMLSEFEGDSSSGNTDTFDPNDVYTITSRKSGKCLQTVDNSITSGSQICQWDYFGDWTQLWRFYPTGDGYYYIINASSGLYMDIYGASTANGANNIVYTYNGNYNQQWSIVPTGDGYYQITNRNSSKVLDIYGGRTTNGADSIQYWAIGGYNQQWLLEIKY